MQSQYSGFDMADDLACKVIARMEAIRTTRSNWESLVQDVYDFVDPTNGQVTRRESPGQSRHDEFYDNTASEAYDTFIAGMYSNFTPSSQRWFALSSTSKDLKKNTEVNEWFNDVTEIVYNEIAKSNFSLEIQQVYADLGIPGRAAIFVLPNENGGLQYKAFHYANTYIAENKKGLVDTLYRRYEWTARQAMAEWPDKVSIKVREAAENDKRREDKFWFIHATSPREDRDLRKRDNINMPWMSVHVEEETKIVLEESGYEEQPFACPRFYKDANEVEGRSPGMKILATNMMIHAMALTFIKKANWDADPPIILPDDDLMAINIAPSMKFAYRPNEAGNKPEFMESRGRYELAQWMFEKQEDAIKKSYFQDYFALLSTLDAAKERTAFEIGERLNEKIDLLGIVTGRTFVELLDPVVNRSANLLMRQNIFPPMPEAIRDQPGFEIEYRGRLAILAKSLNVRSIQGFTNFILPYAEVKPEVLDPIDFDEIARIGADVWGIPTRILKDEDVVLEIREARAQAAEQERNVAMAAEAAKAVPALQQETKENSPLSVLGAA